MSKPIGIVFLLTILSTFHVSYKGIEGVEFFGLNKEFVDCLRHQILVRTNYYREKYHIQPLQLRKKMNEEAQKHANHLADSSSKFEHHTTDSAEMLYGENVAITPRMVPNIGVTVVNLWYNVIASLYLEEYGHKRSIPLHRYNIGTMTQLLWISTVEMGVGVARDADGDFYVVVYYYPKGNVEHTYFVDLPAFERKHVDEAIYSLNNFDMIQRRAIFLSNSTSGHVAYLDSLSVETPAVPALVPQSCNDQMNNLNVPAYKMMGFRLFGDAEACRMRTLILDRINFYRQIHESPRLELKEPLNFKAQKLANVLASGCILKPNNKSNAQSMFKSSPIVFGEFGEIAIDVWYNQIRHVHENMNESDFTDKPEIGNLILLLWKPSTHIGVGISADTNDNQYYVVVCYSQFVPENFLLNLPEFQQSHIDAGKEAQDTLNEIATAVGTVFD